MLECTSYISFEAWVINRSSNHKSCGELAKNTPLIKASCTVVDRFDINPEHIFYSITFLYHPTHTFRTAKMDLSALMNTLDRSDETPTRALWCGKTLVPVTTGPSISIVTGERCPRRTLWFHARIGAAWVQVLASLGFRTCRSGIAYTHWLRHHPDHPDDLDLLGLSARALREGEDSQWSQGEARK